MKKVLAVFLAALLLAGCAAEDPAVSTEPTQTEPAAEPVTESTAEPTTEPATEPTAPPEVRYTFTFAGDCTFGCMPRHVSAGYAFPMTVGEDYGYPFRNVLEYFANDDFSMVNLEGVLGNKGSRAGKRYEFRGSSAYVNILTENSVEAVTLANNHSLDYGKEGYAETKAILEEAGVSYVEANNSLLLTLEKGLTVGIYGTVYNRMDKEALIAGIRELKEQGAELVIYAPHWGRENTFRPNSEQVSLGRAAIDAGADIVFGTHPHVLQPIEEYNGGVIYYSLGNFSFGGNMYPKDYDTALLQQEVIRAADGTVTLGERTIIPCSISSISKRNNYQPTPYEEGTSGYERVISKLDGSYDGPNLEVD